MLKCCVCMCGPLRSGQGILSSSFRFHWQLHGSFKSIRSCILSCVWNRNKTLILEVSKGRWWEPRWQQALWHSCCLCQCFLLRNVDLGFYIRFLQGKCSKEGIHASKIKAFVTKKHSNFFYINSQLAETKVWGWLPSKSFVCFFLFWVLNLKELFYSGS